MSHSKFEQLVQIVKKLRDPKNGCPWDREQTHQTLTKYLIEESYEFVYSVEKGQAPEMKEELGDVLLQILLHTTIAEERKTFNLESVSQALIDKLIRRHPHVFGELKENEISTDEVTQNWKKIKEREKETNYEIDESFLMLPSLMSSEKIGQKTANLNFDWDTPTQVSYKVEEEWQELKEEIAIGSQNKTRIQEELGDLLFSIVQLSRHLKINPEEALRQANHKFIQRFNKMEDLLKSNSQNIKEMTQSQLDEYWNQVKKNEK